MVSGLMNSATSYAPGSTSNLGPGFDCLGIAVTGLGDRVTAERTAGSGVEVRSVSEPKIPLDPGRNTAALAASEVLRRGETTGQGLVLDIEKGLPLAGGLGGSAASAVAGAVAANALLETPLDDGVLLECALEAEAVVAGRHADNVAPSLFGGAVLIQSMDPFAHVTVDVHDSVRLVFVMPGYEVATAEARSLLPVALSRADAVAQAAALGGLLMGLERGDGDLLGRSMVDRIAEPGRIPLYPGYSDAKEAALGAGAWGVAVSGAGPTLVALAPDDKAQAAGQAASQAYEGIASATPRFHVAGVDGEGARVL